MDIFGMSKNKSKQRSRTAYDTTSPSPSNSTLNNPVHSENMATLPPPRTWSSNTTLDQAYTTSAPSYTLDDYYGGGNQYPSLSLSSF